MSRQEVKTLRKVAGICSPCISLWFCLPSLESLLCGACFAEGYVVDELSYIEQSTDLESTVYSCDSTISSKGYNHDKQQQIQVLNHMLEFAPIDEQNNHPMEIERKSIKSEGGKVNIWNGAMKLLNDARFNLSVLNTTANDESVLSLQIMDALQEHLPFTKRGQLFWLQYSMIRDGASMHTLMNNTNGSEYNIIAIETVDGEVFGAFTSNPWHIARNFYGSTESFLWRLDEDNDPPGSFRADQNIEVFQFAGNNRNIQLCTSNRIVVGGGQPDESSSKDFSNVKLNEWGFGLSFENDLQQGTSSPCITFESPPLSRKHRDGSRFEVSNIETWSLTPCFTLKQAQRLEESKRTIKRTPTL